MTSTIQSLGGTTASDCPSRRLEADGRFLRCQVDWHGHGDGCAPGHLVEFDDGGAVEWHDGDPLSWDASCPDCTGSAYPKQRVTEADQRGLCDRCRGEGVVEDIPPSLVGVGSMVEHQLDPPGVFCLVVGVRWGRTGQIMDLVSVNAVHHAVLVDQVGPDGPWRVLRAVPPAADTETP